MKDITLSQARKTLESLGFYFNSNNKTLEGQVRFGTIAAENYSVAPNHFAPKMRYVWISNKNKYYDPITLNRFHVSSSIKGTYRRYRAKTSYDTDLGNIFSLGRTLREAVDNFVIDFKNKNYNRTK